MNDIKRFSIQTYQGGIQGKGATCVLASDYDALVAKPASISQQPERNKTGITYIQQICDVCGKSRNTRKRHLRCSRIRQLRYQGANHG